MLHMQDVYFTSLINYLRSHEFIGSLDCYAARISRVFLEVQIQPEYSLCVIVDFLKKYIDGFQTSYT